MAHRITVYGVVAYDGTDYHGFQVQVGVPTIQGALESALRAVATLEGRVIGSGRTDTGVHAAGQVIAASLRWRHSIGELQRAWNAHLPPSILIHRMALAPAAFHPRFSAVCRTYRYWVCLPEERVEPAKRSPLTDRFALYVPASLNLNAMQEAATCLIGEHDFATFGQPPQGESTVRTVMQADWQVVESNVSVLQPFVGQRLVFTISANGFLRRMVRNIVGSLLAVGEGRWQPAHVLKALEQRNRHCSAPPAPPNGLILERVDYPTEMGIRS